MKLTHRSIGAVVALVLVVLQLACAVRESVDLAAVYERTDRDFDTAILFRPDDSAEGTPQWTLAPLLIVQNGRAGSAPPVVSYERTATGWTYRWSDVDGSRSQGFHATIGEDGFPIAYEVLRDSSGARLLFVDGTLEQAAYDQHGTSLPGRRFSVERGLDAAPDVAVGGVFEPGPTPLGPFVYLWEGTGDVNVVLCRCMPSRVSDIVDSVAYPLIPYDPETSAVELATPSPIDELLRLPGDL